MNTAAIIHEQNRLTCCLLQDAAHARYLTARASDPARQALCKALTASETQEVVLLNTGGHFDSIAYLLLLHRLDVWLAPADMLDEITGLLARRPGTRVRAAITARLTQSPAWLARLTLLTLPPEPPMQLALL